METQRAILHFYIPRYNTAGHVDIKCFGEDSGARSSHPVFSALSSIFNELQDQVIHVRDNLLCSPITNMFIFGLMWDFFFLLEMQAKRASRLLETEHFLHTKIAKLR